MKINGMVTIRPQMIKDAAAFYKILSEGHFQYFTMNVASIEAEKRFLRRSRQDWQKESAFNFSVMLGSRVIGAVGIMPEYGRSYNAEIGYFIDRELHGKGYALQAVIQAEQFTLVFRPEIKRLQAIIVVDNAPSIRVIEKAGYKREGCLKSYLKCDGQHLDAYIYGKVLR